MVDSDFKYLEGPVIMAEETLLEPTLQKKWKNTLIGELLITDELKSVESYHVIRDVNRAWMGNTVSKFTIMELGYDMFGFQFEDERDMKWVMDSRPWLVAEDKYNINQYLLLLSEWTPNTRPYMIKFSHHYPFWIQTRHLPYEYMSREMGKKIGEGTGHQVLEVDFDDTNSARIMKYIRIRVMVDITKKLATGCWLLSDKNKPNTVSWVAFRYEKLPKFCYRCGIIGHSKGHCSDKEDKVEDVIAVRCNHHFDGSVGESELPAVLAEGQVLRVEGEQGYGCWLYAGSDRDEEDEDYNEYDEMESESGDEDYGLADEWDDTSSEESDDEEMETKENHEVIEVTSGEDQV